MRWLAFLLIALVVGCDWPTGSTTTGGTTAEAGAQCPQTAGCSSCVQDCAATGPCASLNSACTANTDCYAIASCWGSCGGDPTCQQGCASMSPNGVSDFQALAKCLYCDQCPTACPGQCSM